LSGFKQEIFCWQRYFHPVKQKPMRKAFNLKNTAGYVVLITILVALLYLLLESRERSQKINNALKQISAPAKQ